MINQELFSTWSETQYQVRHGQNLLYSWHGCRFLRSVCFSSGILVNGQIIGDKKIPPDGVINTYFYRFGITHSTLGVRLEVNTEVITVYQGGEKIKLLWSAASSLKGAK